MIDYVYLFSQTFRSDCRYSVLSRKAVSPGYADAFCPNSKRRRCSGEYASLRPVQPLAIAVMQSQLRSFQAHISPGDWECRIEVEPLRLSFGGCRFGLPRPGDSVPTEDSGPNADSGCPDFVPTGEIGVSPASMSPTRFPMLLLPPVIPFAALSSEILGGKPDFRGVVDWL